MVEIIIRVRELFERQRTVRLRGEDRSAALAEAQKVTLSGNVKPIDRTYEVLDEDSPSSPEEAETEAGEHVRKQLVGDTSKEARIFWETGAGHTYWLAFAVPTPPARQAARELEEKGWERVPAEEGFCLWPRAALTSGAESLFEAWQQLPAGARRKQYMREAERALNRRGLPLPSLPSPGSSDRLQKTSARESSDRDTPRPGE